MRLAVGLLILLGIALVVLTLARVAQRRAVLVASARAAVQLTSLRHSLDLPDVATFSDANTSACR